MKDTLRTVAHTIEYNTSDAINLINQVDSFYNSAWDKLIIVGSVSFGVIGILVPLLIQWYQKKTLKISEELLKKDLENQTLILKNELLNDINKTLDERISAFERQIEDLSASITAKAFHLQGNGQYKEGLISSALSDYIIAANSYLSSGDYSNLLTVMQIIFENCVPLLSQEEIEDLKISHNCDLEMLLNDLTMKDEKGMFDQVIRNIRFIISKLPKTAVDKTQINE